MNLNKIFLCGEEEPLWDLELDLALDPRDLERSLELERDLDCELEELLQQDLDLDLELEGRISVMTIMNVQTETLSDFVC